jgi:hypothetical protein
MPSTARFPDLDGTPRVVPMNAVWVDDELVMGSFTGTHKLRALGARPNVAVALTNVDGLLPEYAAAHRKVIGGEASEAYLAPDRPAGVDNGPHRSATQLGRRARPPRQASRPHAPLVRAALTGTA